MLESDRTMTITHALEWILAAGLGATAAEFWRKRRRKSRRRRVQEFLSGSRGTMVGVYTDLLHATHLLLANALEERKQPVFRLTNNHSSHYAVSVIPAIVT